MASPITKQIYKVPDIWLSLIWRMGISRNGRNIGALIQVGNYSRDESFTTQKGLNDQETSNKTASNTKVKRQTGITIKGRQD